MKAIRYNMDLFHNKFDWEKQPVIFERDDMELSKLYRHNDRIYRVAASMSGKGYVGVVEVALKDPIEDVSYERNITCPVCGNKDHDSWEADDSDEEYECGHCNSILAYERDVEVTYSTRLVKGPSIEEA